MTLQEPRGDETKEEELQRLGIQGEGKKILLISGFDRMHGPIYACPYCAEMKIKEGFTFCCPNCGGDMEGYGFETIAEGQKREEKENEKK